MWLLFFFNFVWAAAVASAVAAARRWPGFCGHRVYFSPSPVLLVTIFDFNHIAFTPPPPLPVYLCLLRWKPGVLRPDLERIPSTTYRWPNGFPSLPTTCMMRRTTPSPLSPPIFVTYRLSFFTRLLAPRRVVMKSAFTQYPPPPTAPCAVFTPSSLLRHLYLWKPHQAEPADGDAMEDSEGDEDESSPPSSRAGLSRELVTVTPYKLPNPGPYPQVRQREKHNIGSCGDGGGGCHGVVLLVVVLVLLLVVLVVLLLVVVVYQFRYCYLRS